MAAPTEPDNVSKVLHSVEYLLQRINHANGFYTDGLVVDRGRDPTGIRDDKPDLFKKTPRAVGIMPAVEAVAPPRTGGVRRYRHSYPIMCLVMLTNEDRDAGLRLDDIVNRLIDDLKRFADPDQKVKAAAAALGYTSISCVNHHLISSKTDESIHFPFCEFVAVADFEWDRTITS